MIRHHVERFLYLTNTGKWIEIIVGFISFLTSITFVVITFLY